MEPGYYDAVSAAARCAAGEFRLCGRVLRPFSFRHCLQLEAAENPLWTGVGDVEEADFLHAARICSSEAFVAGTVTPHTREEVAKFSFKEGVDAWLAYIEVCYKSRPEIWKTEGGSSRSKAPFEEYVIAFVLRNSTGYTRDWLETAAVALVLWIFEAILEQEVGKSRILTAADLEQMRRENTPEAHRARKQREKTAGQIFRKFGKLPEVRMKLLQLLDNGKLPKDWRSRDWERVRAGRAGRAARGRKRG